MQSFEVAYDESKIVEEQVKVYMQAGIWILTMYEAA